MAMAVSDQRWVEVNSKRRDLRRRAGGGGGSRLGGRGRRGNRRGRCAWGGHGALNLQFGLFANPVAGFSRRLGLGDPRCFGGEPALRLLPGGEAELLQLGAVLSLPALK